MQEDTAKSEVVKIVAVRIAIFLIGLLVAFAVTRMLRDDPLALFGSERIYAGPVKIAALVLVVIISVLQISFFLLKIKLKKFNLPFEIIYFLAVFVSVLRITQLTNQYFIGELTADRYGLSFVMEIGAYAFNLFSLVFYLLNKKMLKLTKDMYEKCDICGGDLYAQGVPMHIGEYKYCGLCKKRKK